MEDNQNSWKNIVRKLNELNLTIATMESCTGGGIANEITNISGASSVIRESYVTYCNEAKIKQGVPAEVIAKHTVYSSETAIEMAKAAKKQAGSNIGVGVTGQLGRIDHNNPVEKLNCVWYAVIKPNDEVVVTHITVPNDERKNQKEFVIKAVASTISDIVSFVKETEKNEEIFEKCLPSYLENDLNNLKEGIKNNVSYLDCLIDELQGSVNSAYVDNEISEEQCDYLYKKYIRMEK